VPAAGQGAHVLVLCGRASCDLVYQQVVASGAGNGAAGVLTALVAYRGQDAVRAVNGVRAAVTACSAGFTGTFNGKRTRFSVAPDGRAAGGQQATGVNVTYSSEDDLRTTDIWLVRTDNFVGYFVAVALPGMSVSRAAMTAVTGPQVRKMTALTQ
jgi:hypothetical protein